MPATRLVDSAGAAVRPPQPSGAGGQALSLDFRGFAAGFQPGLHGFLDRHARLLTGLTVLDDAPALLAAVADERPDYVLLAEAAPALVSGIAAANRMLTIGVLLMDEGRSGQSEGRAGGLIVDHVAPEDAAAEVSLVLRGLMRRCRPQAMVGRIAHGDLLLDEACLTFSVRDRTAALNLEVFAVLGAMMDDPSAVWPRARLHALVYGRNSGNDIRAIDTRISRTRRHLAAAIGADPIRTVRGIGYALEPRP